MRRLVAALLVALLALVLSGCGGGGEEQATTPPAQETPAPAPTQPGTPGQNVVPVADRSAAASETFTPFRVDDTVPAAIEERLRTKQPMLILFYDSAQDVSDDLQEQVNDVVADNRGLIDLITYDMGKYTTVDENGTVEVDQSRLGDDVNGQEAVSFARARGVDHLPYIIIIDDQGFQIFWSRGFIDAELLGRQVERASR